MSKDQRGYSASELATYNTLKAAQQDQTKTSSQSAAAAEALRAHVNSVGQRMFNDQQAGWKAGTLTSVDQDGA
jgi:hypothetical protein